MYVTQLVEQVGSCSGRLREAVGVGLVDHDPLDAVLGHRAAGLLDRVGGGLGERGCRGGVQGGGSALVAGARPAPAETDAMRAPTRTELFTETTSRMSRDISMMPNSSSTSRGVTRAASTATAPRWSRDATLALNAPWSLRPLSGPGQTSSGPDSPRTTVTVCPKIERCRMAKRDFCPRVWTSSPSGPNRPQPSVASGRRPQLGARMRLLAVHGAVDALLARRSAR